MIFDIVAFIAALAVVVSGLQTIRLLSQPSRSAHDDH